MSRTFSTVILSFVTGAAVSAQEVNFNRDVRPILSETCFQCHGPDQNQRQAELRLDTKSGLYDDRGGYVPISPGKRSESELFERISSSDPDLRMPPEGHGSLTEVQIATIGRWIEQGARWQGHWAYLPVSRPPVPEGFARSAMRNEIDAFILAKQREQGLEPASAAVKVTLIRRLSFDLTGLPPTWEEVQTFVQDDRPDAYRRLVDRLLDSPRFGERMAMYWLDLVRYADTNGIHGDNHRDVALYRDYVIDAINSNKPFDQFTIEQLAGDLLPNPTDETRIASGYNRLLMTTREGGAQAKEYLAKYAADRVRNTSTVWLGSTLGCAECHDHKFDPFSQKDFYSFAAFFADIQETPVGVQQATVFPTSEQKQSLTELDALIAELTKTLNTDTPELAAEQEKWEADLQSTSVIWTALRPESALSSGGAKLTIQEDGSILAGGTNAPTDRYEIRIKTELQNITGLRLEALPDPSLPKKGPGRAGNGNFVLSEIALTADGEPVSFSTATATHSQKDYEIPKAVDGNGGTGWAIFGKVGESITAVFELKADVTTSECLILLQFNHGGSHQIGKLRLSTTSATRPVLIDGDGVPQNILQILDVARDERRPQQHAELAKYFRSISSSLAPARQRLEELKKQRESIVKTQPKTLISISKAPREMRILPRGNWLDDSGPVVQPAPPDFLFAMETASEQANRLDLARWFVRPENTLTARVMVNRLWMLCFGQGIVSTMDDFGSQGTWPTHPELLDWLAAEFVESGWDVKHMLRLMVNSRTYQQSSSLSTEHSQRDPTNRWLARQSRFRLDAEMVRDQALAVSGLLVDDIGGPSVKPYQPAGYWRHLNFPRRSWKHDTGDAQYRRGLYTYWCRTFLHPSLKAFDASTREECTVQRPRSNTPLQALVLLNDPTYVEAARALAERTLREGGNSTTVRIDFIYRQTLSRQPRPMELELLSNLVAAHSEQYEADETAAQKLIGVGLKPAPTDLDAAELAAWTSITRVVLNLHETITRN